MPLRAPPGDTQRYRAWIRLREPGPIALQRMRRAAGSGRDPPLLSLVVPVSGPAPHLRRCLDSLAVQVHPAWEACAVAGTGAPPEELRLLEDFAGREPRLRVATAVASAASAAANHGLERAHGEWVALLDPAATLAPHAVAELAQVSLARADADVVYSDEDRLDSEGRRTEPVFKPGWSPELFLCVNALGRLCAFRRTLLAETGGLRPDLEGAGEYDLALRLAERARAVVHVPRVLYHRGAPEPAAEAASVRRAVEEALARRGLQGRVEQAGPGVRRVRYAIRGDPLISIVVPTRDRPELLHACLESVTTRSNWRRFELLVVDNGSADPEVGRMLGGLRPPHRVLFDPREFNWAALNNRAARDARGDFLLFLNDDVQVVAPDWMEALAEQAQRPDVAATGAKLLYADGRVQHAGLVLGLEGAVGHAFRLLGRDSPGHLGLAQATRECSAVTGACLMTRRRVFEELGGFDERFRVAYSDVDYCLRGWERGYRVIFVAHALLHHLESATRSGAVPRDAAMLRRRWGDLVARGDPYYNPNLSLEGAGFGLRP